jgi:hypothetical protein
MIESNDYTLIAKRVPTAKAQGHLCSAEFPDEFLVGVSAVQHLIQLFLIIRSDLRILCVRQVGMQFDCACRSREQ